MVPTEDSSHDNLHQVSLLVTPHISTVHLSQPMSQYWYTINHWRSYLIPFLQFWPDVFFLAQDPIQGTFHLVITPPQTLLGCQTVLDSEVEAWSPTRVFTYLYIIPSQGGREAPRTQGLLSVRCFPSNWNGVCHITGVGRITAEWMNLLKWVIF